MALKHLNKQQWDLFVSINDAGDHNWDTQERVNNLLEVPSEDDILVQEIKWLNPKHKIEDMSVEGFEFFCTNMIINESEPNIITLIFKATDWEILLSSTAIIDREYWRLSIQDFKCSMELINIWKMTLDLMWSFKCDITQEVQNKIEWCCEFNRKLSKVWKNLESPSNQLLNQWLWIHWIDSTKILPEIQFTDIDIGSNIIYSKVNWSIEKDKATLHFTIKGKKYKIIIWKYSVSGDWEILLRRGYKDIKIYKLEWSQYVNIDLIIESSTFQSLLKASLYILSDDNYNLHFPKKEKQISGIATPDLQILFSELTAGKNNIAKIDVSYVRFPDSQDAKLNEFHEVNDKDIITTSYCISIWEEYYRISWITFQINIHVNRQDAEASPTRCIEYLKKKLKIEKLNSDGEWCPDENISQIVWNDLAQKMVENWKINAYFQAYE